MKTNQILFKKMRENHAFLTVKLLTCKGFDFGIFKRLSVLFCSVLFCSVLLVMGSALLHPTIAQHL